MEILFFLKIHQALLFKKYANPPLKCEAAAHAAPW